MLRIRNRQSYPLPATGAESAGSRRSLQFVNFYRYFVGVLFAVLQITGYAHDGLTVQAPLLFLGASLAYAATALVAWILLRLPWPPIRWQIYALASADIVVITLMVFACGGVSSGLGMLLIPPLSASSTRLPPRMAGFLAALAAIAILVQEGWHATSAGGPPLSFTQAGILGAIFFVSALVSSALTQRARESETLAVQRSEDLASLAELNERIIQYMQTGVVVTDAHERLRTVNDAARTLLGVHSSGTSRRTLSGLSPALAAAFVRWYRAPERAPQPFMPNGGEGKLLPHFIRLGEGGEALILILLEDERRIGERAHHMKLAALGQLTASIAHQVRNPLGAISHAAQLLGESQQLSDEEQHLLTIVNRHTGRINQIIEDILRLSRQDSADLQYLQLKPLIQRFAREFSESHPERRITFDLEALDPAVRVRADASQIQQIMNNLWENSLIHGSRKCHEVRIRVASGHLAAGQRPYLDVADDGPIIDENVVERMFDPFFTTSRTGTGLGLYIVRELCESNQANIQYVPDRTHGNGTFRISFPAGESLRPSPS